MICSRRWAPSPVEPGLRAEAPEGIKRALQRSSAAEPGDGSPGELVFHHTAHSNEPLGANHNVPEKTQDVIARSKATRRSPEEDALLTRLPRSLRSLAMTTLILGQVLQNTKSISPAPTTSFPFSLSEKSCTPAARLHRWSGRRRKGSRRARRRRRFWPAWRRVRPRRA